MSSDPDQLVDLTTAQTEFEASVMVSALEAAGIPARCFGLVGSVMQWEIAATQPIRVQVRRQDLQRARETLDRTRQDSVDIDWSEVEDQAEPLETCRACGYPLEGIGDPRLCPECGESAIATPHPMVRPRAPARSREKRARLIAGVILACILGSVAISTLALLWELLYGP